MSDCHIGFKAPKRDWRGLPSGRRRVRAKGAWQARRTVLAFLAAVGLTAFATVTPAASAAVAKPVPAMHFNHDMRVETVCFSVINPAGSQSTLYGQRFTDGKVSSTTPAIVLVHGIASSTEDWDFSPTWSVARALAAAGYVVISYDRLGYARSSYFDHPGGGLTLTTEAQRHLLHQVVGAVKTGGYTTAGGKDCSAPQRPSQLRNPKVVIIGHSAGGWVVAGYPGEYHDVAAMVQADITAATPLATGQGGGFTPDPAHPDYFQFFLTRADCETFNLYRPGVVPYVADIACTPPFLDSPFGEITDLTQSYAANARLIGRIGATIPVLLTSGDHDMIVPPSNARAELEYYKSHCGCDVSQLILPDTGHLFMAHRSLPIWIDHVVRWLGSLGLSARPDAGAQARRSTARSR
jgi:pimeloyl-ACP methyl ester carboxylesterase